MAKREKMEGYSDMELSKDAVNIMFPLKSKVTLLPNLDLCDYIYFTPDYKFLLTFSNYKLQ